MSDLKSKEIICCPCCGEDLEEWESVKKIRLQISSQQDLIEKLKLLLSSSLVFTEANYGEYENEEAKKLLDSAKELLK